MPGDPNACRENAARVVQLAAEMSDPEIKKVLVDLAEAWTQLAAKIDAANKIAGDLLKGRDTRSRLPGGTGDQSP
jgi:hypothetical protein